MFKNLATIVDIFGDRVLSLIGPLPMYNHRTMVAFYRTWSQTFCVFPGSCIGHRLVARPSYDGLRAVGDF